MQTIISVLVLIVFIKDERVLGQEIHSWILHFCPLTFSYSKKKTSSAWFSILNFFYWNARKILPFRDIKHSGILKYWFLAKMQHHFEMLDQQTRRGPSRFSLIFLIFSETEECKYERMTGWWVVRQTLFELFVACFFFSFLTS